MNGSHIRAIWLKEMMETLRDKRTLYMMVLLPLVLMPLLVLAGPVMMERQSRQDDDWSSNLLWAGSNAPAGLAAWLDGAEGMEWTTEPELTRAEAEERVAAAEADVAITIVGGSASSTDDTLEITLVYDASRSASMRAANHVEMLLQAWGEHEIAARLAAHGLPPSVVEPFTIARRHDVTPDPGELLGGMLLGSLLPMFAALGAVAGGMYTALDVAAGEKERNSLESLMMAPVSRTSLVLGKFAAIWTVTFVAVGLMILSMTVSVLMILPRLINEADIALRMLPLDILSLFVLMALFVAVSAAIQLSLSVFARSFREGQAYMTALTFVVMLPGMYVTFASQEASHALWTYAVPILNVLIVFQETLTSTGTGLHWTITLTSLALSAVGALGLALYCFRQERVVFRA